MTDPRLDVLCIGNAIVDIIADCDDAFLEREGPHQGDDAADRRRGGDPALRAYGPGARDQRRLGRQHRGGRRRARRQAPASSARSRPTSSANSTGTTSPPPASSSPPRPPISASRPARSMVLVTPDAHRTMNTFLGAAQLLPPAALDEAQIAGAGVLYLEGYLWDPETPRYAMVKAIDIARRAGRKVAFTLSDTFCIDRHRDGFNQLLDEGRIDILFANEAEIRMLAGAGGFRRRRGRWCRTRSRPWSSPAPSMARSRCRSGTARRGRRRAGRQSGGHDRRRRPVRRRLPLRLHAGPEPRATASASARSPRPR